MLYIFFNVVFMLFIYFLQLNIQFIHPLNLNESAKRISLEIHTKGTLIKWIFFYFVENKNEKFIFGLRILSFLSNSPPNF